MHPIDQKRALSQIFSRGPKRVAHDLILDYILVIIKKGENMKLHESIKPISYLKAHASELIRDISENRQTLVITQKGEAKAIIQDIATYEQTKESIALLKILAQSTKGKKEGRYKPVQKAFKNLESRIKSQK